MAICSVRSHSCQCLSSRALLNLDGINSQDSYAPTGGDFVNRRYGITIADFHGTLDSLIRFERTTRRLEAIHVVAFLGFLIFSLRRGVKREITILELSFAIVIYIVLILSPALLQRYNRVRVYATIRRLEARR